MTSFLLWAGIALIVIGWVALSWQAARRMAVKKELDKFKSKKDAMVLRSNYCRLTIIVGIAVLILALLL